MSCCKKPSLFHRLFGWILPPSVCPCEPSAEDIADYHTGTLFKVHNKDPRTRSNKVYYMMRMRASDGDTIEYALFTQHSVEQALERASKNPEDIPSEIRGDV